MKRWLLRIFWFLLSALVVLSAALGAWMYKTSPQYDGEIKVGGLEHPITVGRDEDEVVHIQAASMREAAFGLGFAHAQDRSWQLEFNRRLMHGELSEILGDVTLPTDKLIRTLGIRQAAQRRKRVARRDRSARGEAADARARADPRRALDVAHRDGPPALRLRLADGRCAAAIRRA